MLEHCKNRVACVLLKALPWLLSVISRLWQSQILQINTMWWVPSHMHYCITIAVCMHKSSMNTMMDMVDYENVNILVESSHSFIASMYIGDVFLILAFVTLEASCSSAANSPGCVCMSNSIHIISWWSKSSEEHIPHVHAHIAQLSLSVAHCWSIQCNRASTCKSYDMTTTCIT